MKRNKYYFFSLMSSKQNSINIQQSSLKNTKLFLNGHNNLIDIKQALVESCQITINGANNKLLLAPNVKLRKGIVNIRGNNCTVKIGEGSTFGQVRIVNVGRNNDIQIGKNCLFADNIEIWASDTHSIFDAKGSFINPEKPIEIQDKVWVGAYVKILKGVTIGEQAIIGMNSMVTRDIPGGVLCAGNPLKILREGVTWSLKYNIE
jgi:acetyltransferase-like isoleucine patch superfamily enzyme